MSRGGWKWVVMTDDKLVDGGRWVGVRGLICLVLGERWKIPLPSEERR